MDHPATPPENLSPEALGVWEHVTGGWELDPRELAVLRMAVRALSEASELEERAKGAPLTVPSAHGDSEKPWPGWAVLRAQRSQARQLLMSIDLPEPREPAPPGPEIPPARRRPPRNRNTRERRGPA